MKKWQLGLLMALVSLGALGLMLFALGRRAPTQQERDNRKALEACLTAITLKNARLLAESAKQAKARHEASQLTDEQYRGMKAFIDKAGAGDWLAAEKDAYAFRKKCPFVMEGQ